MLAHAWTYQALVHDLLKMNLNRVVLEVSENNQQVQKSYDLDYFDTFWREHTGTNFPQVAVEIETLMKEYKSTVEKAPKSNGDTFNEDDDDHSAILKQTKDIGNYVNAIPEIQQKHKMLDMHTRIGLQLLDMIKERGLDIFCSLEEGIMNKTLSNKDVLGAITNNKGSPEDKIRLFLIYFMSNPQKLQIDDLKLFLSALEDVGCDLRAYHYLQKIKAFNENWAANTNIASDKNGSKKSSLLHKIDKYKETFNKIVSAGVKYIIPTSKDLYVTRIVDALIELKPMLGTENYLYYDPRFPANSTPRKTTPFKEVIVFMVGGGNYIEYLNIKQKLSQENKRVVYGSTEILSADKFLQQLTRLAESLPKKKLMNITKTLICK